MKPEPLKFQLVISTPIGAEMVTNMYYKVCEVMIGEVKTWVNLVKLGKMEYDVILGIDWLPTQCAHIDCHQKKKKNRSHSYGE